MIRSFIQINRNILIIVVLCMAVAFSGSKSEKIGDNLQVVLPVMALVCSAVNGEAGSLLLRYIGVEVVLKSSKFGLGAAAINIRPNGGTKGFPSGHTTVAIFGTSNLLHSCITANPWVKGIVIISGGYVGASRIEAGAHFLFQVLAGALLGWLGERSHLLFRRLRILMTRQK